MVTAILEKLSIIDAHRFVLSVGDQGAILSYFHRKKLMKRLFASACDPDRTEEFVALLKKYPAAPISILVDVMDQSYVQNALPPVGVLSIGKLVKQRLKRDFSPTDLTGAIQLGRSKEGRKDWNYLLISVPMVAPLTEWVEFVYNLPNRCDGIYLLPVESVSLIKKLGQTILKTNKDKKLAEWQLLGCHDKVGGFRQVVTHNGKVVFTRMVSSALDNFADIVAGNIEQEVLNTLEYLKRISLNDGSGIDIHISIADDIKQCIDPNNFKGSDVFLYTPYDLALALDSPDAASDEDKFIDTVFASNFIKHSPSLKLSTKPIERFNNLYQIERVAISLASIAIPVMFIFNGMAAYDIIQVGDEIKYLEEKKRAADARWQLESKNFGDYDIETATKISNITELYKVLSGDATSPLEVIRKFGNVIEESVQVKSIAWKLSENTAAGSNNAPNTINMDGMGGEAGGSGSNNQTNRNPIELSIDVLFVNKGTGFDSLFADFNNFSSLLKSTFSDYEVTHTQLPSKISFQQSNEGIPIQITIKGPNG